MRHKNKTLVCLGVIVFVAVAFAAYGEGVQYFASQNSTKYHRSICEWAKKISPRNLITFSSPEEAIKAGFTPCSVCQPPTVSSKDMLAEKEPNQPADANQANMMTISASGLPNWGRVYEVKDGDTVYVDDGKRRWEIRLLGINAPEKDETGYEPAKKALVDLVLDKQVYLMYEKERFDMYNRVLAYLYLIKDDTDLTSVDAKLLQTGWVKVYLKYPGMFQSNLLKIEEAARSAHKGLFQQPETSAKN